MSSATEWLANLSWQTVVITVAVLFVLRYVLLKMESPAAKGMAEIAESLGIAMALVFLVIRPFFVQAFFIPSPSMVPTLIEKDHILVNKAVYRIRDPKHGDVVVFDAPPEALEGSALEGRPGGADYIKRVIGVPGDEIYVVSGYVDVNGSKIVHNDLRQKFSEYAASDEPSYVSRIKLTPDAIFVDNKRLSLSELKSDFSEYGANPKITIHPGYVVRNGKKLNEPYIGSDPDWDYPSLKPYTRPEVNLEKAIDRKKITLIKDKGHLRVKLSRGEYMMMGDNRGNSSDSRVWGPLDRDRVIGRAMFTFFPFNRIQWIR